MITNCIDHTKTNAQSPQTNGICERFHKRFCRITFGTSSAAVSKSYKKTWAIYNERTHQGKVCCERTPIDTLVDVQTIWVKKDLAQI
ncbi:hypothetical protein NBRC116493_17670 [Aurantivibrio infirmus]